MHEEDTEDGPTAQGIDVGVLLGSRRIQCCWENIIIPQVLLAGTTKLRNRKMAWSKTIRLALF
jgi:hypothetical protein